MPAARKAFVRTTGLLLAAAVGALVLIVAVALSLTLRTAANFEATQKARAMRAATVDLLSLVQDAETGQRGYLLTREEAYLAPYDAAMSKFDQRLAALSAAVVGSPVLSADVESLADVLRKKLAELKTTVDLGRSGRYDAASAIIASNLGAALMEKARAQFDSLLGQSERDLQASLAEQNEDVRLLSRVMIAGALTILVMAGAAVLTILRYAAQLVDARAALETVNRELEERVRLRTDALAKANAEIQRFAYVVTHDLRSPLVNIMGFASELEMSLKTVDALMQAGDAASAAARAEGARALQVDAPEAIDFIRSSSEKMDRLVKAFLKISREGTRAPQPEAIDLEQLLKSAASLAGHQVEHAGGAIEVRCLVRRIVADRLSLEQIAANLIDNAIKYRAPERPLRLEIRTWLRSSDYVAIAFEDNGRGIAESDYERIFELFRRSGAQDVAGEGIGLAHVRTLVRNLGGEIAVQSKLGLGSTFTVTAPRGPVVSGGEKFSGV